jgi:hypothetical protein
LYFISFLAIVDFIYLCGVSDWVSVIVFASVGFLVTFFNKNMIVVFSIAMVVTHLLKYGIQGATMNEGFEDGSENALVGDSEDLKKIENEEKPLLPANMPFNKENKKENKKEDKDEEEEDEEEEKKEKVKSKMTKLIELKKEFPEFKEIQKEIKSSFDKINPLLSKAENFIEKFNDYKAK